MVGEVFMGLAWWLLVAFDYLVVKVSPVGRNDMDAKFTKLIMVGAKLTDKYPPFPPNAHLL
jgi:hypothetical protein